MPRAKRFSLAQKLATVALGASHAGYRLCRATPRPSLWAAATTAGCSRRLPGRRHQHDGGARRCQHRHQYRCVPGHPDGAARDLQHPGPAHHHGAQRAGNRRRRPSRLPCHLRDRYRHHGQRHDLHRDLRSSAHPDITGFAIKHGDRVVLWNGTSFGFVPATVSGIGVQFSFTGSGEDFAVLAPRRGGQYVVPPGAVNAAAPAATEPGKRFSPASSSRPPVFLRPGSGSWLPNG